MVSFVFNLGFFWPCMFIILEQMMKVDLAMIHYGIARSICLQQTIFSTPETKLYGQIQSPLKEIHPAVKFHNRCSWIEWNTDKECESGAETGCSKFTKKSCTELGLSDSNLQDTDNSRIVGGIEVEKDAYPSFARVLWLDPTESHCSGVIINENWILTAAHCFVEPDLPNYFVVVGRQNISEKEEDEQLRVVDRWVFNADADGGSVRNDRNFKDLLLMHVKEPFKLDGRKAAAVKLPTGPTITGEVMVVGAGKTTAEEDEEPTQILQVQLDVFPDEQCKETIGEPFETLLLCMRKEGEMKSACQGDSGGPIYSVGEDNSQTLVGTTVFGVGGKCGMAPNVTTVALETFFYMDWIKSVTAS